MPAGPDRSRRARRLLLPLAKLAVTGSALAWLATGIDLDRLAAAGWPDRPEWLAAAAVCLGAQILVGAARWQMVLASQGCRWRFAGICRAYLIGMFFSLVLPGSTLTGDVIRIWAARQAGLELATAAGSVIVERVVAVLALAVLVLAVLPWLPERIGLPAAATVGLGAAGLLAVCLAVPALEWLPAGLRRFRLFQELGKVAVMARRIAGRPAGAVVLANAGLGHLLIVVATYCLAMALGTSLAFADALLLVPPVLLAVLLPVSAGGWGVREGAMVLVLASAGIAAEPALMVSVWLGLLSILATLPGAVLWFAGPKQPEMTKMERQP